jgi:hypothetical protein
MPKAKHNTPSIIDLLKQDHEYVKKAYRRFEKMDHKNRPAVRALVTDVCAALETHVRLEEELFYPAVRKVLRDDDLMHEAEIAHEFAKMLIRRLKRMRAANAAYLPTFTVLCEYIIHHAKEEESEIFAKAQRRKLDVHALGRKAMARKIALERRA